MIQLGKKQYLTVVKKVDFGVYLSTDLKSEEKVLLPIKQVPEELDISDTIEVFVYRDSKDRLIATVNEPKLQLGQVALLKVAQVSKIGAFLDWGLEKDILLPFKEQTKVVNEGEECLVTIYTDKSSRLCATMKVYEYLDLNSDYQKDDVVTGLVYQISEEFGAFVAIDYKYSALVPRAELYKELKVGERISARVTKVLADGKLSLGVREKAYLQIDIDCKKIKEYMESNNGIIHFTDKAPPEVINKEFQMSKSEFKRAIGNLLKKKYLSIDKNRIIKNNI